MIRLAVRVARADAELVLVALLDHAPAGVEELDISPAVVEYAIYGAPGELPELPDVRAAAGAALVEVSTSRVPDDWGERWKEFHRPVLVGDPEVLAVRVRAPWEAPLAGPRARCVHEIVIDPGQAFGTGAHATTRMCLELLLELEAGDRQLGVCDVGCGSGVLAIAASKLGFGPVTAVDHDRLAVEATESNARINGVELDVARCDLRREPVPAAPLMLANLLAPLLGDLGLALARLAAAERPRRLIASGLLAEETQAVGEGLAGLLGLALTRTLTDGEWGAVLLGG